MILRVLSVSGVCKRDEIRPPKQSIELDLLDAEVGGPLWRQIGVERHDLHLQSAGAVGNDSADIAAADDPQALAGNLDADQLRLGPFAGPGGEVGQRNLTRQRQHQGDGMLGGGDGVAERRVHDDDAARRGGFKVDIIHADAGTPDHLELVRGGDDLLGHLRGRAHRDPVIAGNDLDELVAGEIGFDVSVDPAPGEDIEGQSAELVGNKHLWRHCLSPLAPESLGGGGQAACVEAASSERSAAKAQSSQGSSASRSLVSTVAPHQSRKPGGASR